MKQNSIKQKNLVFKESDIETLISETLKQIKTRIGKTKQEKTAFDKKQKTRRNKNIKKIEGLEEVSGVGGIAGFNSPIGVKETVPVQRRNIAKTVTNKKNKK